MDSQSVAAARHRLELKRRFEPRLVAGELREIERTRIFHVVAGDLRRKRAGHECLARQLTVEGRPELARVAGEALERQAVVMAEIAELAADQQSRREAERDRAGDAERDSRSQAPSARTISGS